MTLNRATNETTTATANAPRCPACGGTNGTHGLVHTRHGNGGGHNRPCPNAASADQTLGEMSVDPLT